MAPLCCVCAGDVSIARSAGRLSGGFSHWTSITAGGVTEAMVSAITHDGPEAEKTNAIMDKIDADEELQKQLAPASARV